MSKNRIKHLAALAVGLSLGVGGAALAQRVDQGMPGSYGPWNVRVQGGGGSDGGSPSTNTYTPAATSTTINSNAVACSTAGGASCTIILASIEMLPWERVTLTVRNSGANAITNCLVEWSPDNTNWEVWDNTTFAALAAGAIKSIAIDGNSRRFLRVEAQSAAGSSSVVNITAAQN